MNLSSIFLGSIPSDQRKFLRVFLEFMRKEEGITRVIIPCVGQFGAVKCALEAGFTIDQIECSDISLFTSLLGYYYGEKDIEELNFGLVQEEHADAYAGLTNDQQRVAFLMVLMKMAQLRTEVYYEKCFFEEIRKNFDKYMEQVRVQLEEGMKTYRGLRYEVKDLRWYFLETKEAHTKTDLIIMNPPAFAKGYTKMFNFHEYIVYLSSVPEFDFSKEYMNMYHLSKNSPAPFLWHTSKPTHAFPQQDIIFAKQLSVDKYGCWLFTEPDALGKFKDIYTVVFKGMNADNVQQYRLLPQDYKLTAEAKVSINEINKETALYYRDLFAHRLGSTVAEVYFGIFLDGYLMSVCGFNTSFLRRLQETYIFENFCFSISHNNIENLNRVSMMFLCSGQFKRHLENNTLKGSAYVQLKSFKTTCLTKYRKSKLNNNLLKLTNSDRQENGTYKLTYESEFYMDRDYKRCIELFLTEDIRFKKTDSVEEAE